tara:strand:+ start:297 stop:416 length:120 start_codon:yes stop_codon:yes gene_type:complete
MVEMVVLEDKEELAAAAVAAAGRMVAITGLVDRTVDQEV